MVIGLDFVGWLVYLALLIRTELEGGREIRLTDTRLIAPKYYWASTTVAISYTRITELVYVANRSRLWVKHSEGTRLGIAGTLFPSQAAFDEFIDELHDRVDTGIRQMLHPIAALNRGPDAQPNLSLKGRDACSGKDAAPFSTSHSRPSIGRWTGNRGDAPNRCPCPTRLAWPMQKR